MLATQRTGWEVGFHVHLIYTELTLTTNATRLDVHAQELFDAGVRRINVSLDSRDPDRFADVTRGGDEDVREVLADAASGRERLGGRHRVARRSGLVGHRAVDCPHQPVEQAEDGAVALGGQNMHDKASGAFTGLRAGR